MKKILSLLLLSSFAFCTVFNSTVDSTTNKDMIYRMNYQNADGSRGAYVNTTVPKLGWLNLNGYTSAPVTANMVTGNAVLYYDYTATSPKLTVWFKDVSGNVTEQDIGATSNVVYSFASTAALASATFSGAVEINDTITLENDETIDNANNGVIGLTATTVSMNGALNVDGAATIDGDLILGVIQIDSALVTAAATNVTANFSIPVTINGEAFSILLRK